MPRSITVLFVSSLFLSVALSACGRKAPLDAPSAVPVKQGEKQPEPPVEDKPFVLDRLIK
jgi:predicted small lipoprotein YifL